MMESICLKCMYGSVFLQRFEKYIAPVANINTHLLMPNHFHFLAQIESDVNEKIASQTFGNLINSYAKASNKLQKRIGNLKKKQEKEN